MSEKSLGQPYLVVYRAARQESNSSVKAYVYKPDGSVQGPLAMAEFTHQKFKGMYYHNFITTALDPIGEYLFVIESSGTPVLRDPLKVTFGTAATYVDINPDSLHAIAQSVWDEITGLHGTQGTYGYNLKSAAQEPSVQSALSKLDTMKIQASLDQVALVDLINLVKVHSDYIPLDPATEHNVDNTRTLLAELILNLGVVANAVKEKTDRIPTSPATEESVLAIDDGLLRSNDPRLLNLDVKISSRATPVDISNLTTHQDLNTHDQHITLLLASLRNTLVNQIADLPQDSYFTPKFNEVLIAVAETEDNIIAAMPQPSGSSLTAKAVWEYSIRTLTSYPAIDISNLATKEDIRSLDTYETEISMLQREATQDHELVLWVKKNGATYLGNACSVALKNADGVILWDGLVSTPSPDGVYKFIHAVQLTSEQNCYLEVVVVIDGLPRQSRHPVTVVGV